MKRKQNWNKIKTFVSILHYTYLHSRLQCFSCIFKGGSPSHEIVILRCQSKSRWKHETKIKNKRDAKFKFNLFIWWKLAHDEMKRDIICIYYAWKLNQFSQPSCSTLWFDSVKQIVLFSSFSSIQKIRTKATYIYSVKK